MFQVVLSIFMLVSSVVGFFWSFWRWKRGEIGEKAMVGVTLVLSWAALWYTAVIAIFQALQGS